MKNAEPIVRSQLKHFVLVPKSAVSFEPVTLVYDANYVKADGIGGFWEGAVVTTGDIVYPADAYHIKPFDFALDALACAQEIDTQCGRAGVEAARASLKEAENTYSQNLAAVAAKWRENV